MTDNKFTSLSQVLKNDGTSNEEKKKVDWSDVGEDNNEIWEEITSIAPSIDKIQQEQTEEENQKWPQVEQEKKEERREGIYQPPRQSSYNNNTSYNNNGGTSERRERPPRNTTLPDDPPYNAKINNLNYKITEDDIYEYFKELGVKNIRLLRDRETKKFRGMAIVEFEDRKGLENALTAHGEELMQRNMEVSVEIRREYNNQGGPGGNKPKYNFRNRYDSQPQSQSQSQNEQRERRPLNVAKRTLPLEKRHLNPGFENLGKEDEQPQEKKNEQKEERKSKENPYGGASPVQTKYIEPRKIVSEGESNQDQPKQFQKQNRTNNSFQNERRKNNNYNNNKFNNQRREYDNDNSQNSRVSVGGFTTRGGKKNIRGGRGGPSKVTYSLKKSETQQNQGNQQSNLQSNNMYSVLFEGNENEEEQQVENTE